MFYTFNVLPAVNLTFNRSLVYKQRLAKRAQPVFRGLYVPQNRLIEYSKDKLTESSVPQKSFTILDNDECKRFTLT